MHGCQICLKRFPLSRVHVHIHALVHVVIIVVPDHTKNLNKILDHLLSEAFPVIIVAVVVVIIEVVVDVHDGINGEEDERQEGKSIESCLSRTTITRSTFNLTQALGYF